MGKGLELQREERQFKGIWEELIFGKEMFAMPWRDNETKKGL